jgi:hypothetical protein
MERRAALRSAIDEGLAEALGRALACAEALRRGSWALMVGLLTVPLVVAAPAAATACSSSSKGASQVFELLSYFSYSLLGIGGVTFVLMVSIGALMVIFGGTTKRVYKGQQMVKDSVFGLAVLVGGVVIRYVIMEIVFSQHPGEASLPTTCS